VEDTDFVSVYTAEGKLSAEIIRLMLESFGIHAVLFQESVGPAYGIVAGPIGEVQIIVPSSQAKAARELLAAMEKGELELPRPNEDPNLNKEPGFKPEKPHSDQA